MNFWEAEVARDRSFAILIGVAFVVLVAGLVGTAFISSQKLRIEEYEDGSFELFRAGKHIGSGCLSDHLCED